MPEFAVAMLTPHGDPLGRIGEPEIGGQCVYIRDLAIHLARQGFAVSAFTRDRGEGKPPLEDICPGARVRRLLVGPRRFVPKEELGPYLAAFADGVTRELGEEDVLHSHFWDGASVARELRNGRRWIHTSHSLGKRKLAALPEGERTQYAERIQAETAAGKESDVLVASTSVERQDLVDLYGVAPEKIEVVPPGVDTLRFSPREDKAALKRKLGLPAAPLAAALGRLDARKGYDLFLRAAAQLLSAGDELAFVLSAGAADDPREEAEYGRLRRLVRELALGDRFRWLDVLRQEELPAFYGAADVFAMPSRYELFGIVMLEAMACGVPVVATRFGGPAEVIEDGADGLLVDPTDIPALAGALHALLRDPDRRAAMGERARKKVEQGYSWDAAARRHMRLYRGTRHLEGHAGR